MGEMADQSIEDGILSDVDDEYYEDRLISELRGKGMSVSAIGAKLGIPIDDVIISLKWSGGDSE